MAANVETMFYTREKPWHGLGTMVMEAPTSARALELAGLDWRVEQRPVQTEDGIELKGFFANIRSTDQKVLGVVTDKYRVVQNEDAFAFTDALLGEGVTYETAGSLQEGRKVWLLAKLPHRYIISGDEITPYLVFSNSHDGSGAIRVAMTPVRVVCNNTLNLALETAKRSWSAAHIGNLAGKMQDARQTLLYAEKLTPLQKKNISRMKEDLRVRFYEAPDLKGTEKDGYRFINAVSDFATHAKPIRETKNYRENLFGRTVDGNALIDRAYDMMRAA